ncbi:hypothetical protein FAI40_04320 [Acetobacteraceae bacterium]|nr:hypothetical protein FAI40_04320 [Acetobacteraceae bacterium]
MTEQQRPPNWFKLVKEIIKDFSDLEFLEKAFNGRDGLLASTGEMCACALDDYTVDEWLETYYDKLPPRLRDDMTEFVEQAIELPGDSAYETLEDSLYSPEWVKIRALAASLTEQLEHLPDPKEN